MGIRTTTLRLGVAAAVALLACTGLAQAQATRKIVIANDCQRPLQVMVYRSPSSGSWIANGWYKFEAHESYSVVRSGGTPILHLEDQPLYFYAETTDGGEVKRWQGGGVDATYQGGTYRTMKANTFTNDDGDIAFRLTCP